MKSSPATPSPMSMPRRWLGYDAGTALGLEHPLLKPFDGRSLKNMREMGGRRKEASDDHQR